MEINNWRSQGKIRRKTVPGRLLLVRSKALSLCLWGGGVPQFYRAWSNTDAKEFPDAPQRRMSSDLHSCWHWFNNYIPSVTAPSGERSYKWSVCFFTQFSGQHWPAECFFPCQLEISLRVTRVERISGLIGGLGNCSQTRHKLSGCWSGVCLPICGFLRVSKTKTNMSKSAIKAFAYTACLTNKRLSSVEFESHFQGLKLACH